MNSDTSLYRPLADRMRPDSLDDVCGQEHILGRDGVLRRVIESARVPNMIFYGPSGTGKTTVAGIIAGRTSRALHRLNATTASISDIKEIISSLDTLLTPNGALLYLDEIQYFNKKQQQSLLEFIENGKITLIASTTENPYFYVYNAILSRSTVFEFKPLSGEALIPAVRRAFDFVSREIDAEIKTTPELISHIATASGGDARKAVSAVELLTNTTPVTGGVMEPTLADAKVIAQRSAMRYDRDGDEHYDILSALQKSIRGSDPDAALHYLARLLEAGDIISACRRLLVMASEDIGLAYPQAVVIVKACCDNARELGLPEAVLPLSQAAVLMATAPKSNSAGAGYGAAMSDIQAGRTGGVPVHLRDSHYQGAEKLGRGIEYKYPHAFPNNYVAQQYLPDELAGHTYYKYGSNKLEQASRKYWEEIKGTHD